MAPAVRPIHFCHLRPHCRTPVPPEKLLCPPHWAMVPTRLKREIWRHYREGQCDDKRPSRAWHAAADAAIKAVLKQLRLEGFHEELALPVTLKPSAKCRKCQKAITSVVRTFLPARDLARFEYLHKKRLFRAGKPCLLETDFRTGVRWRQEETA
jgi:hypothetical protein